MFFALGVLVMRVVHNLVRRLLGHVMMYLEGLVSAFASPPTDGRRGPEMLAAVVSGCSETAVPGRQESVARAHKTIPESAFSGLHSKHVE
jgi:hypothetical protein